MRGVAARNQKGAGDESPDALREVRDGRDVRAWHANDTGLSPEFQTILAEYRTSERRVVRESERREYYASLSAAQQRLAGESFVDDRGRDFAVGASVLARQTIPYHANDGSGVKWMASGTRGEIVTFAGTREYPTAAIQFDGRLALHLFNARELRAVVRVIEKGEA